MTDWTPEQHSAARDAADTNRHYLLKDVEDVVYGLQRTISAALTEIERLEAERDRVCGGHAGETFSAIDDWHYCPRCGKEIVSTDSAHQKEGSDA